MCRNDRDLTADIRYSIFDPTGNITALVESHAEIGLQPDIAAEIMRIHPDVEQVGFVRFDEAGSPAPVQLRMAGGEFCGNATMCAAALYLIRHGESKHGSESGSMNEQAGAPENTAEEICVQASGVEEPLRVRLSVRKKDSSCSPDADSEGTAATEFDTGVLMPPALGIEKIQLEFSSEGRTLSGVESIVRLPGIDHIVLTRNSGLYPLGSMNSAAEEAIKEFCSILGSDCLGMMFLNDEDGEYNMKPLVYVPGADTIFWENSCASGTAAAGMYLAAEHDSGIDISVAEPAGRLRVMSDPDTGETWLYGSAKLIR